MSPTARDWTPIHLPELPPPAGAYSPGVRAGNLLFVSGQTPRDPATGQIVGTTVEEQARLTLANVERILGLGGATLQHVVSVTVYLADEDDWGRFNEVYKTVFTPPYPTRAVVGAELRGILVEISAIAYLP
ncbi:MAG: reactive intermediate/imine deaminase [Gemmatimonadaceae bacterium]|nr:reactive intermediate/imine deaminase [Gemmatimonadaceae bacterium]